MTLNRRLALLLCALLKGRGGDTNYHIGNHRFRLVADEYKQRYHVAGRKEKALIVQELVDNWRNRDPPGRFLTRTDPSKGEDSLWHDVGNSLALKKAAKILSERSSEYRESRKRKAESSREAPPDQKLGEVQQIQGAGTSTLQQQQPLQAGPTLALGYQASCTSTAPSAAYPGAAAVAEPLRQELSQRMFFEGGLANLTQAAGMAPGALMPNIQDYTNLTPGGGRDRGTGQNTGTQSETGAEDDSPETVNQDAVGEVLPSAAYLAGVFTSSSSDANPNKDSSPSTDQSSRSRGQSM
jgi:hypothetical protein